MTDFKNMPPHSRLWIYQSTREFSENETKQIESQFELFIEQWTSHGKLMNASVVIYYNRFVIICVDEKTAPASGCGIDKSIHFMQQLEKDFNISLFDRMNVAYKKGEKINSCSLSEFEKFIESHEVDENTIVYNNLVSSKSEFENNWEVPLKKSWHCRLLVTK